MKPLRNFVVALLAILAIPAVNALEKQPAAVYHARRVALSAKLNGGVAVLFAATEPVLDFDPYRQDPDFYYLTGWNEPGAALLIVPESVATSVAPRLQRDSLSAYAQSAHGEIHRRQNSMLLRPA